MISLFLNFFTRIKQENPQGVSTLEPNSNNGASTRDLRVQNEANEVGIVG